MRGREMGSRRVEVGRMGRGGMGGRDKEETSYRV